MKSMQQTLMSLRDRLVQIQGLKCYHFEKPAKQTAPYAVWAEDGEADAFSANNRKEEIQIGGVLDYYTQKEFDAMVDALNDALNEVSSGWTLESIQREDETKLIHYHWSWSVV